MYLCLYMLIILSSPVLLKSSYNNSFNELNLSFSFKDVGQLDYFVGIKVHYLLNGSLLLSQSKYIRDLHIKTYMSPSNSIASPMALSIKLGLFKLLILPI